MTNRSWLWVAAATGRLARTTSRSRRRAQSRAAAAVARDFALESLEGRQLLSADLSATSVTRDAGTFFPGNKITASADAKNIGDAAATGTLQVSFYASTDGTLNAGDVLLKTISTPANVVVGGNVHVSDSNVSIPASLKPGTYHLLARFNPGANPLDDNSAHMITEDDYTNNVASSVATFVIPDPIQNLTAAVATSPTITGTVNAGSKGTTTVTLTNPIINLGATGKVAVSVYLSKDGLIDANDLVVATQNATATTFQPGLSKAFMLQTAIPTTAPVGTYNYLARVTITDPKTNAVLRTIDNVISPMHVTVADPLANVQVTLGTIAPVVVPGDKIAITLKNPDTKAISGPVTINIYASMDGTHTAGDGDVLLATISQNIMLAGKGSLTLNPDVSIPKALAGKNMKIVVTEMRTTSPVDANTAVHIVASPGTPLLAWQFGNVVGHTGLVKLTTTDADGTIVNFSLTGPGTVTVDPTGNLMTVTAVGTTVASVLHIDTVKSKTPGDDGLVNMGAIIIGTDDTHPTSIGSVLAPNVNLDGTTDFTFLKVTGGVGTVTLRNLTSTFIDIGRKLVSDTKSPAATVMTFNRVMGTSLETLTPITTLTVTDWLDDDATNATIILAPSMGTLKVGNKAKEKTSAGDFEADMVLGGAVDPKKMALGTVSVLGTIRDAAWSIAGNVGAITAGAVTDVSIVGQSAGLPITSMNSFTVNGDVNNGTLAVAGGNIGMVKAKSWLSGAVTARTITTINVANAFNPTLTLTGPVVKPTDKTLGSATIGGGANNAWSIAGSTGALSIKGKSTGLVLGGALIDIASLTLDNAAQVDVHATGKIGAVKATTWTLGSLAGMSVASLNVTNAFNAGMTLTGVPALPGKPAAKTLGSAMVGGGVTGATWNLTGATGALTINGNSNGFNLGLAGAPNGGLTDIASLTMGNALNVNVNSTGKVGTVTAKQWTAGHLNAKSAASLNVQGVAGGNALNGDLGADINLTSAAGVANTLGAVTVKGAITGGSWHVTGNGTTVSANSTAAGWTAAFTGNMTSLSTKAMLSGNVAAAAITTITVGSDMDHATVTLNKPFDATKPTQMNLTTLSVAKGTMNASTVRSAGNIGTATVGIMQDSLLAAGMQPAFVVGHALPTSPADFASPASIKTVNITNLKGQAFGYMNSDVLASNIGSVTINNLQQNSTGHTPFGVAARFIKTYTRKQDGIVQKTVNATPGNPVPVDSVGDYVEKIII